MTTDGTTTTDGSEADVAEQHADLVPSEDVLAGDGSAAAAVATESIEADPADVADQHRSVPYDEDER